MSEAVFWSARISNDLGWKTYSSAAFEGTASRIIIASKFGRAYKLRATNKAASTTYYVMLFDKATAPVNGNVPFVRLTVKAASDADLDLSGWGHYFANGLAIALSTTADTLTLASADDAVFYVGYASQA